MAKLKVSNIEVGFLSRAIKKSKKLNPIVENYYVCVWINITPSK